MVKRLLCTKRSRGIELPPVEAPGAVRPGEDKET
jgi:hypothetical protein